MMGLGMGGGLFGLVFMVLIWGALIALALWLVRALFPGAGKPTEAPGHGELTAGEILARRYARGEIDQTEYQLMKETLADKSE
jgi:putative membrane protein